MTTPTLASTSSHGWLTQDECRLDDFRALVEQTTTLDDYPYADAVEQNVLLYDSARLREHIGTTEGRRAVQAELATAMMDGPGIVVFKGAFEDTAVVDRATAVFRTLLAEQKASGVAGGDHFAKPGANDRLWAALEKLAERDPEAFAAYYANDIIALAAVAWLGPNYQIISDLNVVNPGGQAQVAHRDYHLGFMEIEQAARYPAHVHRLSPIMTLQGAIAHCDMPVETGPTMYLPYSQRYVPGYMAVGLQEFRDYFDAHYVQLPLAKGDAVFFNPAVFHGAGTNRSRDVERMANLLQISSAFGRMLETVDREKLSIALYPTLRRLKAEGAQARALRNIIAASAEGYPFPTNLDRDQPVDSLNPESQAELVWRALAAGWDQDTFLEQLRAQTWRRQSGPARA
jgi:ectoine hydroxylase-related dioxygenase (phytanoyl-CoA dioxygenase family)